MIAEIKMPRLDEDMLEGTVTRWLKKEGETVQKGEAVLEIETQKVNFQVEAPASGTLLMILAREGDLVPINGILGVIGEAGEDLSPYRTLGEKKDQKMKVEDLPSPGPRLHPSAEGKGRVFISPVARKLAEEMGLDIAQIRGTGPDGRITKEDVLRFRSAGEERSSRVRREILEVLPLSGIRKTIADRMMESWHQAPRAENYLSADVSRFLGMRSLHGKEWEDRQGIQPTFNDLVVAVTARALAAFPRVNSSLRDGRIEIYKDIHISIAVALEDGLITPVVRHADQKNIFEIARETRRLTELVRSGKHRMEALSGSTFTITNLGMYGIEFFVPVLNPPESAILSVGAIERRPVVIQETIAIQSMVRLGLAYDHRVLDGAMAARFLLEVKKGLEDCEGLFPSSSEG